MTNKNQLKEAWRGEKTQAKDSGHICSLRKKNKKLLCFKQERWGCKLLCGKLVRVLLWKITDGVLDDQSGGRCSHLWQRRQEAVDMESKGRTGPRDTQKIKTKGCDCTGHLRGVERRARELREKQARAKNISRECVQFYTCWIRTFEIFRERCPKK